MHSKHKAAVLYLDAEERALWERPLAEVPDLLSIEVNGAIVRSLQLLAAFSGTLRVVIISARLYPAQHQELAETLRDMLPGVELLLISPGDAAPPLAPLFADGIRHLAIGSDQLQDRCNLPAVVAMLMERRPWQIDCCLEPGTPVHSFPLHSSDQKETLIARLEELLAGEGEEMELLRQKGALLADELLENALYDAPRAQQGGKLFRKGERRELLPQEQIVFRFGFDGKTLGLQLTDSWGSLEPEQVLEYLMRNQEQQPTADDTGGRGLFIIWRFLDRFHVDIQPGQLTTVGGELRLNSGRGLQAPRGFHITTHQEEIAA